MDRNRTSETVKLHDAVKIQEQEKLSWAKMQDCFSWIWYVRFQTTNQIRPREKQGCRGFGIILCSCYLILFCQFCYWTNHITPAWKQTVLHQDATNQWFLMHVMQSLYSHSCGCIALYIPLWHLIAYWQGTWIIFIWIIAIMYTAVSIIHNIIFRKTNRLACMKAV